jgi:hypothetical protein
VASKARGASSAAAVPDRRHVAQAATANVARNDAAVGRVVQAVAVLKVATVRDVAPADREHRGAVVSAALRDQVLAAGSVVASAAVSAVAALVLRLAVDSVALAAKLAIAVAATITRTAPVAEIAAAMSVVLAVTMVRVAEIGRAAREAIGRRNCIPCK